ncbi:MAG TPA: hypothetical protein VKB14_11810 [Actinomycetales bacterium]|nr:hypothetical protein [Actinomycetales bacterium]
MSGFSPTPSRRTAEATQAVNGRLLRYAGVVALVISAVVHGALAGSYGAGVSGITLGKLFVVQAVVTFAVAVWLLLRDVTLAWLAGAAIMGGTALALVLAHTGSGLPQLGPIPGLKEESYDAAQLVTLAAEAAYLVLAAVRLLLPSRSR